MGSMQKKEGRGMSTCIYSQDSMIKRFWESILKAIVDLLGKGGILNCRVGL